MSDTINLTIDGEVIEVARGATLLDAAQQAGVDIPVICYHEATSPNGLCRICVVDVDGGRVLQPACVAECQADSKVETRNERVERSRRTILEMLNASVNLDEAPEIQQMMGDYAADQARFPDAHLREHTLIDDNPFYVRDYEQCVLCWRCVQVCAEDAQFTFALTLKNRGHDTVGRHRLRYLDDRVALRILRAMYWRLPDRRAEAEGAVGHGAGLERR